jgi:signal transduction histidine kinase
MLIFLSTALIFIALLYLLYFLLHNLHIPGPVPPSDWLPIGLASSHLVTFLLIIKLAKEGKTRVGSALWLGWYGLTITAVSLPNIETSFQDMAARLMILSAAAGPLLGAWWSVIVAGLASLFETGIVLVMAPSLDPDSLVGVYMRNLLVGSTMWLFTALLEQGLAESEALRREADNLRDMALEISRLNFNLLENTCQQVEIPLSLIVGYASLLMRTERSLSREGRRVVEMIRHNSYQLNTIIRDTLSLSQLQSLLGGSLPVEFSPSSLLTEVTAELASLVRRQRLQLEWMIDPHLPDRCIGHPVPLKHALMRAVKGVAGEIRFGRVTLEARLSRSDRWHITISSTSGGLTQEKLDLLSHSLSQDDTALSDSLDRNALGLLLARELILSTGGNLFVESSSAGGTIMTIDLPLVTEHPQAESHPPAQDHRDTEPGTSTR